MKRKTKLLWAFGFSSTVCLGGGWLIGRSHMLPARATDAFNGRGIGQSSQAGENRNNFDLNPQERQRGISNIGLEPSRPDGINISTIVQAISAAISAVFAGFLYCATRQQIRVSKKQIAISGAQADLMVKQKEIMRQSHIATHRPRLVVREVEAIDYQKSSPPRVGITITNSGFGACSFDNVICKFTIELLSGGLKPFSSSQITPLPLTLQTGQQIEFLLEVDGATWFEIDRAITNPEPLTADFFCQGKISCVDESGITRWSGFRRKFDNAKRRFTADGESDRNYSD